MNLSESSLLNDEDLPPMTSEQVESFGAEMDALADWFGQQVCRGTGFVAVRDAMTAILPKKLPSAFRDIKGKGATQAKAEMARQLAPIIAYSLWNGTPQPDHGFRPIPADFREAKQPCPCGSGRAMGDCCLPEIAGQFMIDEAHMLSYVVRHLPSERLDGVPRDAHLAEPLAVAAEHLARHGRPGDAIALLKPLFANIDALDASAEMALEILLGVYDHFGQQAEKQALIDRVKSAPNRHLQSAAWQREASIAADRGDAAEAWRCFEKAAALTPDDPVLSHLEVLMLLNEGRPQEAMTRARHWINKLGDAPEHAGLVEFLETLSMRDEVFEIPAPKPRAAKKKKAGARASRPACTARLQLKIQLDHCKPVIWRRVVVNDNLSFGELHQVIQTVMGWENCHLHQFDLDDRSIAPPEVEGDPFADKPVESEDATYLSSLAADLKKFSYWYDFGDDWMHTVGIEKRLPVDAAAPPADLLAGKNACPPEDCGGPWGYRKLMEKKAAGTLDADYAEWLGEFDPEEFELEEEQEFLRRATAHFGQVKKAVRK